MEIKKEHKELLMKMGLSEEDLKLFDGKNVRYEFHEEKGVRIYDPFRLTSYEGYIDIDGWSSWSSEEDRFMENIKKAIEKGLHRFEAEISPEDIKKRFEG